MRSNGSSTRETMTREASKTFIICEKYVLKPRPTTCPCHGITLCLHYVTLSYHWYNDIDIYYIMI